MSPAAAVAWRAFPWDPAARPGARWSPTYVPPVQGQGRFDLPGTPGGVLYLAESPDHAAGERIQAFRGQRLEAAELTVEGKSLAVVPFDLPEALRSDLVDLCDPATLARLDLGPDRIAARDRGVTHGIAARLHAEGAPGFRWWSAFFGEWHSIIVFRDRMEDPLEPGEPEALALDHPAVVEAARALGVGL
ncbi:MAG TPA: RES family NAD+ phosphorylase [Gemmatimonadota bacterium]|nr:RES family NAD+ phosphorylase [Gemmatimonadota bacterium]